MTSPRYEDFRYSGADDVNAINSVVSERQQMYSKSGANTSSGEQKLSTFLATPTKLSGDEIIIRMTEFADENGRPSGALFDSIIAESTGRRVMSANLPGIDFYGDASTFEMQRLNKEQAHDLRHGSFRKVGDAIMKSVHNAAVVLELDPHYIILGTSMSAAIAASSLNTVRQQSLDIRGVTFAEPVNMVKRPMLKLGAQFIATNRTAAGYVAMNPTSLKESSEPVMTIAKRALRPANFLYATALANGSLIRDIGPTEHLKDVPVYMSRGGNSSISPAFEFEKLETFFKNITDVEAVTHGDNINNPHDHGYVLSVQPFIDAAENILRRSNETKR